MSTTPFFSFLLITYNQEMFIEEAFQSLLKQTDRDFEIIICDDNSKDKTFQICTLLVDNYRRAGGDIPIVLHRNEQNKGIGGNFHQAYTLSHGKWLLMAAGDDISLTTRLEIIRKVIMTYPNAYGINTARYFVNEKAEDPRYNFKRGYLLGADSAWHRDVFTQFPPMDNTVMSEDHILNLRAMLLGEMIQINTPTINYRVSSMNYSIKKTSNILDAKSVALKKMSYMRNVLLFRKKDLEYWKRNHPIKILSQVEDKINKEIAETDIKIDSYCLFIHTCNLGFSGRLKYLFTSSDKWLHTNIVYRFYNLLKMYKIIKGSSFYMKGNMDEKTIQDDKIYVLTLKDFMGENIF